MSYSDDSENDFEVYDFNDDIDYNDYDDYNDQDYYDPPRRYFPSRPIHEGRYHDGSARALALDCEMVENDRGKDMLARVSIVDMNLRTKYDKFVAPTAPVRDYRTRYSGVRPSDLINAENFYNAQAYVRSLLSGSVLLVGHGVDHDLEVLQLTHPNKKIRDTSSFGKFYRGNGNRTPALRNLALIYLNETIQSGEHNSVEDAKAAMKLYLNFMR